MEIWCSTWSVQCEQLVRRIFHLNLFKRPATAIKCKVSYTSATCTCNIQNIHLTSTVYAKNRNFEFSSRVGTTAPYTVSGKSIKSIRVVHNIKQQ